MLTEIRRRSSLAPPPVVSGLVRPVAAEPSGDRLHFFVDDDRPSANVGRRIGVISITHLIVVDDLIRGPVPDPDAEQVHLAARGEFRVNGGQHEPILALAIDGIGALELRLRTGNYQPLAACAVEVQARFPTSGHNADGVRAQDGCAVAGFTSQRCDCVSFLVSSIHILNLHH